MALSSLTQRHGVDAGFSDQILSARLSIHCRLEGKGTYWGDLEPSDFGYIFFVVDTISKQISEIP